MKRIRLLVTAFVLVLVPFLLLAGEGRSAGNIAVASNERVPSASVADRMGRSQFYLLYDADRVFIKAVENPNFGKRTRPEGVSAIDSIDFNEKGIMTGGIPTSSREERQQTWNGFSDFFGRNGITVVVAEEFGEEIVRGMKAGGIECVAFKGSAEQAVESIIRKVKEEDNISACNEEDETCSGDNKAGVLQIKMRITKGDN